MLDIGVRYSIYVSHVDPKDGPKSFYLQVVSEGWSERLDKLLDELAESYMTLGSQVSAPSLIMKVGRGAFGRNVKAVSLFGN